ncbi:MAG: T9SS type A sorting domain-containing protein [Candidatus Kapaibacterium sp.]
MRKYLLILIILAIGASPLFAQYIDPLESAKKRIAKIETDQWREEIGEVTNREVYEYTDGNQYLVTQISWRGQRWDTVYKSYYYLDEPGRDTLMVRWDKATGEWERQFYWSNEYDAEGRPTETVFKSWLGGKWVPTGRQRNVYNSIGNDSLFMVDTWSDGQWLPNVIKYFYYGDDDLLDSARSESYQEGEWVNDTKYEYTYPGNEKYENSYRWRDGEWKKWQEVQYYYTGYDELSNVITYTFMNGELSGQQKLTYDYIQIEGEFYLKSIWTGYVNFETGEYEAEKIDQYLRDDAGTLEEIRENYWRDYNDWRQTGEQTRTYDGDSERLLQNMIYYLDYALNIPQKKISQEHSYEYYDNNLLKTKIIDNDGAQNKWKVDYLYDDNQNNIRQNYYDYKSEEWILVDFTELTYDADNKLAMKIEFDIENEAPVPVSKYEYTYYTHGKTDSARIYQYDESSGEWRKYYFKKYNYELINGEYLVIKLVNTFFSEGSDPRPQYIEYEYDAEGHLTLEKKFDWDASAGEFYETSQTVYTWENGNLVRQEQDNPINITETEYDADGDPVVLTHSWAFGSEEPEPSMRQRITYLDPVSVAEPERDKGINIYPNPAGDELNIELPDAIESRVNIYNISGNPVMSFRLPAARAHTLPIGELSAGAYVMQIHSGGEQFSGKIIIE